MITHVPSDAQHAPAHGLFGEHVVPTPWNSPGHPAVPSESWHAPNPPEMQHAPDTAKHGFGKQSAPFP